MVPAFNKISDNFEPTISEYYIYLTIIIASYVTALIKEVLDLFILHSDL